MEDSITDLFEITSWGFLLVVAIGLFTLAGGLFDWDWFMTDRKARFFVRLLGRTGARVFYIILGIAVIVFGITL